MAFTSAAGYGNLPNGNFSPVIYSKQVQLAFRKSSTVEDITNNDYFGEIAQMGDTVKIIKEPEISVICTRIFSELFQCAYHQVK